MNWKSQDLKDSLTFFVFVAVTALCLSFTFSIVVYRLGLLDDPQRFLIANLVVSACVAIPTATIASQHEFQLKRYQRELESYASQDPLTGVLNRRFFRFAVEEEMARQQRTRTVAALAMFDLDKFKSINDRYGHKAGDEVLKRVAEVVHSQMRGPFDKLGRWGGEEFILMLSDVTEAQAHSVIERIRDRIENTVITVGPHEISVTASFGFDRVFAKSSFNAVVEAADAALYQSKSDGRNRVTSACRKLVAA